MKVKFNRWYNTVLTVLLSMLGYTSCSNDEDDGRDVLMYGVPSSAFRYKGLVTDEAGTPVQGIKMSVNMILPTVEEGVKEVYGIDSVLTDTSGRYQLIGYGANTETKLLVEDIDGEANGGEFQSDTLDIDFEKRIKIKEGDGNMNGDSYEINQDIKLKKK